MSWAKLDDGLDDHPKFIGRSLAAVGLWTLCLTWAHRGGRATGDRPGFLPANLPARYGGTPGIVAELVAAGIWEEAEGGWAIHGFFEYVRAEDRTDVREARARAGRMSARVRSDPARVEHVLNTSPTPPQQPVPVPVPEPVPQTVLSAPTGACLSLPAGEQLTPQDHEEKACGTQEMRVFEAWKQAGHLNGRAKLTEDRRRKIRARLREFPVEDVLDAAVGIWESAWHVEQGQTELSLALRDGAHLERFRDTRRGIVSGAIRAAPTKGEAKMAAINELAEAAYRKMQAERAGGLLN